MGFKQFVWDLMFKGDEDFILANIDIDEKLKDLSDKNKIFKADLEFCNNAMALAAEMLKQRDAEIEKLKYEKIHNNGLEEYWNNKYTKVTIQYPGRPLPFGSTNVNVPLQVFLTPDDPFIIKDLESWLLYDTEEDFETLIPKIYKRIKGYYKYAYDKAVWGTNELWEFPFETRIKIKAGSGLDCDSWSHFQASYYLAAGLPEWRLRVVCGETPFDDGHSTVYIYSLKDNMWHHLNSTYGKAYNNISDFPTNRDAENDIDNVGIKKVWFSFNNKYCWYKFGDKLPDEVIKEEEDYSND